MLTVVQMIEETGACAAFLGAFSLPSHVTNMRWQAGYNVVPRVMDLIFSHRIITNVSNYVYLRFQPLSICFRPFVISSFLKVHDSGVLLTFL